MRLALAICVVMGCTLCGGAMAGSYRRRAEMLASLIGGIGRLRVHMMRMLEPVAPALCHSECPVLEAVGRAMAPRARAGEAWHSVAGRESRRGRMLDALTAQDRQLLDDMFAHLGESGREQQEMLLNNAIAALRENLNAAEIRAKEANRLSLSLGTLVGLMLALIVI